jgi:hypothetical protein
MMLNCQQLTQLCMLVQLSREHHAPSSCSNPVTFSCGTLLQVQQPAAAPALQQMM